MRVSKNESINHVGESWKTLAQGLSKELGCDVEISDFGWMLLHITLSSGNSTTVQVYVDWTIRKGKGIIMGYCPEVNKTPFVCSSVRTDSFITNYGSVAARIKSVLSGR